MRRLPSSLLGGVFLAGVMGISGMAPAAGSEPPSHATSARNATVEVLIARIDSLARAFGDAHDQREATRRMNARGGDEAAIHRRMTTAVERLKSTAADADHRTARRILERFNDAAFSFARNYLGPGEAVIEAAGDEARGELRRYRKTVSRMKGNLFSWNPDLDQLLADLTEVTRLVENRLTPPPATGIPVAGL